VNRPKLLLFDTNCIIKVMELGLWDHLCQQYRVVVPSIIVHGEAQFFTNAEGRRVEIVLGDEVAAKKIEEFAAELREIAETRRQRPTPILERADDGEVEAITYLRLCGTDGTAFLTADGPAIQACVALQVGDAAISLDALLSASGCGVKTLDRHFTDAFVAEHKQKGMPYLLTAIAPPESPSAPRGKPRHKS
jgi:hypothetical protein